MTLSRGEKRISGKFRGGFPSGQRDQTVNLTRKLRWFESTSPHHKAELSELFVAKKAAASESVSANCMIVMRALCNGKTSAFQADDAGSIPATRSNEQRVWRAHIAQSVEHFLGKEEVTGSNPVMSSMYL